MVALLFKKMTWSSWTFQKVSEEEHFRRVTDCQIFRNTGFKISQRFLLPAKVLLQESNIYLLEGQQFFCSMEETILFWKMSLHLRKLDLQTKRSYINNCFLENNKSLRWLVSLKFRFVSLFKFREYICKLISHYSLFEEQQMC